jgi:hypothetical protein
MNIIFEFIPFQLLFPDMRGVFAAGLRAPAGWPGLFKAAPTKIPVDLHHRDGHVVVLCLFV